MPLTSAAALGSRMLSEQWMAIEFYRIWGVGCSGFRQLEGCNFGKAVAAQNHVRHAGLICFHQEDSCLTEANKTADLWDVKATGSIAGSWWLDVVWFSARNVEPGGFDELGFRDTWGSLGVKACTLTPDAQFAPPPATRTNVAAQKRAKSLSATQEAPYNSAPFSPGRLHQIKSHRGPGLRWEINEKT